MSENPKIIAMEKKDLTSYLKEYGFLIPNAEIYQGLASSWDLGSQGTELKRNLKNLWWKYFITSSPYNVGCDSQIITHPKVLVASGHQKNFCDWLVECGNCRKRYRLDNLISPAEFISFLGLEDKNNYNFKASCPNCGQNNFSSPRKFNLLLSTNLEIVDGKENIVYLRPETAQGIFVNFPAIQRSTHRQLPFGVGQIGKSFRNEITLRHGIFRTREFEQLELEFFCSPTESEKWWNHWTEKAWIFLNKIISNNKERVKQIDLKSAELPHYAQKTLDFYFQYHFGWGELCSNSHRGNYDLSQHSHYSGKKLSVGGVVPEVVEVSFGVERLMLATLEDAYHQELKRNEDGSETKREVLKLHPLLAPYFVVIIPLPISKDQADGKEKIRTKAYQLYCQLLKVSNFAVTYEKTSDIGKSYRRQDMIGTYYCLTIDDQTLENNTITCRQRDTTEQIKLVADINSLKNYLNNLYEKYWQEFAE